MNDTKKQKDARRYRGALDRLLEGCQIIGFDYRYIYVNGEAARQGKSTPGRLTGASLLEMYPGIEKTALFAAIAQTMNTREPIKIETSFSFADGASGWFELSIQPVSEGVIILSIETTERKRAELALQEYVRELETAREHESLLAAIVENTRIPVGVIHTDGRIREANQALCDLLGYTRKEFESVRWIEELSPPEWHECEMAESRKLWEGIDSVLYEKELLRKDGQRVPIQVSAQAIRGEDGRPLYYYAFLENLRERKQHEAEREALLAERGMLLQELQHRVRNSLNTIGAILYLKEAESESDDTRNAIQSVRERTEALALLYRQLDATASASIRLDEYLRAIVESLGYEYGAAAGSIKIDAKLSPVVIDLKRGANLGLIANELLINSFKHGFPPYRLAKGSGSIDIALREDGGLITMKVGDDGIGFPGGFPDEGDRGLGLNLVYQLSEQISGTLLREEPARGTRFSLTVTR